MRERLDYLFVGIDPHKHQHTAVAVDFFRQKVFEVTFANKPSSFAKLLAEVEKRSEGKFKKVIFGLEDTNNFGRNLAVFLKE